jgi:hypothetical protein
MQIQINTDHNIGGHQALAAEIRGKVENALSRFSAHITRVEVHLSDGNSLKSGLGDKRCVMEARLESRRPIAVLDGDSDKLARLIENTLGRLREQKSRRSDPLPPGPTPTAEREQGLNVEERRRC